MLENKIDQFLQQTSWADFQRNCGQQADFVENVLCIKHSTTLGLDYLYIPRGIVNTKNIKAISNKAREIGCIFTRIEPGLDSNILGQTTKAIQPQDVWVLELDKTETEILAGMKPKTRYNLRLAAKKGVEIKASVDPKDIKVFYKISKEMAERQKIRIHSEKYYRKLFISFVKNQQGFLYLAYYQDKVIAANLVVHSNNTATYVHGSSANKFRNVMAPYVLQWQAIQDAQQAGLKYYDFGGVAPQGAENHSWQGITRFKQGFGGELVHYPDSVDIIYSQKKYKLYKLLRIINKIIKK